MDNNDAASLIRRALILAQVVASEDSYDGRYVDNGLETLNDMISMWGEDSMFIPYIDFLSFPLVAGKFQYRVSPLPSADVKSNLLVQVTEGNVEFDSPGFAKSYLQIGTYSQHNAFNYNLVPGVPANVFLHEQIDYGDLYFFPSPSQSFICNLTVKKALGELTLFEQILNIPRFYRKVMLYQLASDFADYYTTELSPRFYEERDYLLNWLKSKSKKNLSVKPDISLAHWRTGWNGAAAFWGGGF